MSVVRQEIIRNLEKIPFERKIESRLADSAHFAKYVFSRSIMQRMLSKEVYAHLLLASKGKETLNPDYADSIAFAIREWAMSHGVTHFCHWFLPLTGTSAEKHDAFSEWNKPEGILEKFSGQQLIQGEPDASSLPSGGLRCTSEARGHTIWDPTSPIFLWKGGEGLTLCIPSVFVSTNGEVLDDKLPLIRSEAVINKSALRLLQLVGLSTNEVHSTLGIEQEFFVVDRALRNLRQDLVLVGKTVIGAPPAKGQELQDHYLGSVQDRVLSYMQAVEIAALEVGIPVKTRHNEVAPAQHEIVPAYEKSNIAVDHNILLMELMRRIAREKGLACLLHEKPFAGINGSGKHCNWSLATDTGLNLLSPGFDPQKQLHFVILLTAVIHAVFKHSTLLRASIGSASNDYRLGGYEAPPSTISIYLGQEIEQILEEIEQTGCLKIESKALTALIDMHCFSHLTKENNDRNRTSPFAFSCNKFEFRAVGASANPSLPITILNLIVAQSLDLILDEIETVKNQQQAHDEDKLESFILPVLQKYLILSKSIRFSGDNYSEEWKKESQKRGLPTIARAIEAFQGLTDPNSIEIFKGVLSETELKSRQQILTDHYIQHISIESKLMIQMFRTQILPVSMEYQNKLAESFIHIKEALAPQQFHLAKQGQFIKDYYDAIEEALVQIEELEKDLHRLQIASTHEQIKSCIEKILPKMQQTRESIDILELMTDNHLWPLPKYWELLFMV